MKINGFYQKYLIYFIQLQINLHFLKNHQHINFEIVFLKIFLRKSKIFHYYLSLTKKLHHLKIIF
jgi:hypothetical protein